MLFFFCDVFVCVVYLCVEFALARYVSSAASCSYQIAHAATHSPERFRSMRFTHLCGSRIGVLGSTFFLWCANKTRKVANKKRHAYTRHGMCPVKIASRFLCVCVCVGSLVMVRCSGATTEAKVTVTRSSGGCASSQAPQAFSPRFVRAHTSCVVTMMMAHKHKRPHRVTNPPMKNMSHHPPHSAPFQKDEKYLRSVIVFGGRRCRQTEL